MSEVATVSTGSESTSSQTDSGYMGDAFNEYLNAGVDDVQPEEQKTEENTSEKPEAQIEPKKEGEKPEEKDIFQMAFENTDGNLDYEKIMSTSFDDNQFQELKEDVASDEPVLTPEQEIEKENSFRESITSARLGPLDKLAELVNGGMEIAEAYQAVYNETKALNDNYFKERENSQFAQRRETELSKIREEARDARLTEISKSNALSIVNTLPGNSPQSKVVLYNHIMFSDDAGGSLLEEMFISAYPDYEKMPKEDLDNAKKSFVNKIQADPKRLRRHFDRSYRLLAARPNNLKRFAQTISRNTESQVRSNALAAQKTPQGAVGRPSRAQSGNKWDGYFQGGVPKTRI